MLCEPTADSTQPTTSNGSKSKQLSFVYQPGVGLYDQKKIELDQDLRIASTTDDVLQSPSKTDGDRQRALSPVATAPNLYKSYLRRQNEQDSLPIRQKLHISDETLSDNHISPNQENQQKRKAEQNLSSNKKLCQKSTTENPPKANSIPTEQQSFPIKPRTSSNERPHKYSITPIIKSIPMVRKFSSENRQADLVSTEKEGQAIPSQGLLLCPKEEPRKKKKKKKITSTSTALLDDDSVLDSILFNEIQSVQQQWQQFLALTMEKELHINPCESKKKGKMNKFHRSNEFLSAYESLYNFEGMKHWYPTSR